MDNYSCSVYLTGCCDSKWKMIWKDFISYEAMRQLEGDHIFPWVNLIMLSLFSMHPSEPCLCGYSELPLAPASTLSYLFLLWEASLYGQQWLLYSLASGWVWPVRGPGRRLEWGRNKKPGYLFYCPLPTQGLIGVAMSLNWGHCCPQGSPLYLALSFK